LKVIEWKFIDGSTITLTKKSSEEDVMRVAKCALMTQDGKYPSINSIDFIDDVIDFNWEYLKNKEKK
jgi:hypothetical protein